MGLNKRMNEPLFSFISDLSTHSYLPWYPLSSLLIILASQIKMQFKIFYLELINDNHNLIGLEFFPLSFPDMSYFEHCLKM